MEENIDYTEIPGLKEFSEWISSFCSTNHLPGFNYDPAYEDCLNAEYSEILEMSPEESYAYAIILTNYSGFLNKQLSIVSSQLLWCSEAIDFLCSRSWNQFDKYMPANIKKQCIIADNSYAQLLKRAEIRLYSSKTILEENCNNIKKRISLFQDLGKVRSFK